MNLKKISLLLFIYSILHVFVIPKNIISQNKPRHFLIILDSSESMNQSFEGKKRLDIAKSVLKNYLQKHNKNYRYSFMAYGSNHPNMRGDCNQTKINIKFDTNQKSILKSISQLKPNGPSPLGKAIIDGAVFLSHYPKPRQILVISDGLDGCGYDLDKLIQTLNQNDVGLHIIFIGNDSQIKKKIPQLTQKLSQIKIDQFQNSSVKPIYKKPEIKNQKKNLPKKKAQLLKTGTNNYPNIARQYGIEGQVLVGILINKKGNVQKVNVLKSSGYKILDKNAVKIIQEWKFTPAYYQGKPTTDYQKRIFVFSLYD